MMYWWLALVIAIEQFTTIMCVCVWFFTQAGGTKLEGDDVPKWNFAFSLKVTLVSHFGTVLSGSFMVAVIWTLITMIQVYKEAIKAAMSHEKLEKVRDLLIECAI